MSAVKEVHICPILMRTVIWKNGYCTEECDHDCPFQIAKESMEADGLENDRTVR